MSDCLFCKIVKGDIPSYPIWQDKNFIAILDIFPATIGQTLVISKKHYSSDFSKLPDSVLKDLSIASKKVAQILTSSFTDVSRTCLVLEGFDIDHIHAKLYPMHGLTPLSTYLSSKPSQANSNTLESLQQLLKSSSPCQGRG